MSNVIPISGAREAPKAEQSRMDTIIVTPAMVSNWKIPPFQRPVRINDKVRGVTDQIKRSETIEGVLTLGKLKGDSALYIVDGQHRVEAFRLSEIDEAIVDVRVMSFDTVAEMADEFVRLNSSLVKMRPDDILRGMEKSTPILGLIRKSCEFVGYDQIRRGSHGPIVSMSALLRCWSAGGYESASPAGSMSAMQLALNTDQASVQNLIAFLATAHGAWGRDPEYHRLWGALNLTLCMWLWNKLVMDRDRSGNKRYALLNVTEFKHCLMSVSASGDYIAWLPGRNLTDRDRGPCYGRLKSIFAQRLKSDRKETRLPAPAWASR